MEAREGLTPAIGTSLATSLTCVAIYERLGACGEGTVFLLHWEGCLPFPHERRTAMWSLGIDQHERQITISLRDENGDVLLARQVSTQPEKIQAFFQQLTQDRLQKEEEFVAILEVCGFNDWLIRMLQDYRCYKVIPIQPDERKKCKTDRRDAAALSELLWVNRGRLLQDKPVRGLRQVDISSSTDQENRRLTTLRKEAGQDRTRLVNTIRHILRRHNLQWEMPTKTFPTQSAVAWLKQVVLPEIDRLEMNHLLADLEQVQQRLKDLEAAIARRSGASKEAAIIATMPGVSHFTATSLACRVGRVERFPRAHSLANYWGDQHRLLAYTATLGDHLLQLLQALLDLLQIGEQVIHLQAINLWQNQLLQPSDARLGGQPLGGHLPLQIVTAEDMPDLVHETSPC